MAARFTAVPPLPPPIIMTRWDCAGGRSTVAAWSLASAFPSPGTAVSTILLENELGSVSVRGEIPLLPPIEPPLKNNRPSASSTRCAYIGKSLLVGNAFQPVLKLGE